MSLYFKDMKQNIQKALDKFNKDMEKNFKFLKQDLKGQKASSEDLFSIIFTEISCY